MHAKEVLKLVLGAVIVYVVMAACSSGRLGGSGRFAPPADASLVAGSSGGTGSDGLGSSGARTSLDDSGGKGILDAFTDPIASARADTNQSGSRLKAKNYVGSDGSKQFIGLHDSVLNIDCSFLPASDGTLRCMSIGVPTGIAYSDPGCAQPLAYVTKGCTRPSYAYQGVTTSNGPCGTYFYRIFQVGEPYAGPLYTGFPTSCAAFAVASTTYPRSTFELYSLGSEVPPSAFVAAAVETDP